MGPIDTPAPDTVRAAGALTTRLSDALGRTRGALDAHAGLVPGGTLAELDALLADFDRRRLRIAVYGEVKAGKSTLVNALAGTLLSPVAFEPLTTIPVRITYGSTPAWRAGDQVLPSVAALETLMRNSLTDPSAEHPREVVVETDLDVLGLGGQVDLIDTPGVGAESHFDAITAEALQGLDAVVLVVRYPALFTRFTRHLVETLDADIGKLFVVWNLDGACTELTTADRDLHAATLRRQVVGAHDLCLVDARAALAAAARPDLSNHAAHGLDALTRTLRGFAASGARDLTALRQTAKRVGGWLEPAMLNLRARQATLDEALAEARRQLEDAAAAAARQTAAARDRFGGFAATVEQHRITLAATAEKLATDLRRELHTERRKWIRTADAVTLDAAVSNAVQRFATTLAESATASARAFAAAATDYGATADPEDWEHPAPVVDELVPADRQQRATAGRFARLRRSLWKRWYLPGLTKLETDTLTGQVSATSRWAEAAAASAREAGNKVLETELTEIDQRAAAEAARIKDATNFAAVEAEHSRLVTDVPTAAAQGEIIRHLAQEALPLLRTP